MQDFEHAIQQAKLDGFVPIRLYQTSWQHWFDRDEKTGKEAHTFQGYILFESGGKQTILQATFQGTDGQQLEQDLRNWLEIWERFALGHPAIVTEAIAKHPREEEAHE